MTLFTKKNCQRCQELKKRYDLAALGIAEEVLDNENSGALAHLAWHSLVEAARKSLPLLVLDDCTTIQEYASIERHLATRALACGPGADAPGPGRDRDCVGGGCTLN